MGNNPFGAVPIESGTGVIFGGVTTFPQSDNATGPVDIPVSASRTCYTNSGASASVTYNLPEASAGLDYVFVVMANQNLVVAASGGDSIKCAGDVAVSGTSATSGVVGGMLRVIGTGGSAWYCVDLTGIWDFV